MWCKRRQQSKKSKSEEIYFMLKALQFKSGSRDAFNSSFALWFIYLFDQLQSENIFHNYPLAKEIKAQ